MELGPREVTVHESSPMKGALVKRAIEFGAEEALWGKCLLFNCVDDLFIIGKTIHNRYSPWQGVREDSLRL